MRRKVEKLYYVYLIAIGVWFIYLFISFRLNVEKNNSDSGYQFLKPYETYTLKDDKSPIGIRKEYFFEIPDVSGNYNALLFYSYHQNVRIYLENNKVYTMEPSQKNKLGDSPGCVWNTLFFERENTGKALRVVLYPAYSSAADWVPKFYFGNRRDILKEIVRRDIPEIILSALAIFIGILYIILGVIYSRDFNTDNGLIHLGGFAVLVGVWKLADTEIFGFVNIKFPAFSQLTFLTLMLLVIPFILYIKHFFHERYQKIWFWVCVENFVQIAILVFMQIFRLADFRQTLIWTHISIVFTIVLTVALSIHQGHRDGWNKKLKNSIIIMACCFLGATVDIIWYYIVPMSEATVMAMLCFGAYILLLGVSSMREVKGLLRIGIEAQHYEDVAYHDQLTGLLNRASYADAVSGGEYNVERTIVIMFDLNDLKKCNDQLGHEKGDIYIRESARIIKECFGDVGKCFRTGGDEFCALIQDCGLEECRKRVQQLRDLEAKFNASGQGINMQIALGYEVYNQRLDYDIGDTVGRADKAMYREKYAMKEGRVR